MLSGLDHINGRIVTGEVDTKTMTVYGDLQIHSKDVFTYRIIQEALNNVIKHANLQQVLVQLSETTNEYHFIIEDDGKGFDPLQIKSGLGLKSIQSRVDFLQGKLDIDTRQGIGTTLSFHVPKNPHLKQND